MDFFKEAEQNFKSFVENDRLSHSYIFFGESQKEIFDFAKRLANFLEIGKFKDSKKLLQDLSVIGPNEKGNIGIDEIRDLQKFLYTRPAVAKRKTAIIDGFENLTDYAQSAILKIVEEPPKQSLIILIGQSPENLLPTVSSRFQKIFFPSNGFKAEKKKKASDNDDQIEKLNDLIGKLSKDVKKNHLVLKEALNCLSLMKRFNLNKKLQIRVVDGYLKGKDK
ncbi:MAG: hypothetical protein NUV83_00805 [Candidatus Wolfebacteria bacterium]|nr:hypothetical protein [Candidatus Wolfebacteria bacterium]